jgi:polysaccharide biosynthesis transport protein
VRIESSETTTIIGAASRRRGTVVAMVIGAVLLTLVASIVQEPQFRVESVVLVRTPPDLAGTGDFVATTRLANEVTLATSQIVLDRLRSEFGRADVTVESDQQASVLRFIVEHPDPVIAVSIADRHAELYLEARLDGQVSAYLASAEVIRVRIEELDVELSALETRFLAERARAADPRLVEERFGSERASLEAQRRRYLVALDDVSLSADLAATGGASVVNRAAPPVAAASPAILRNLVLALVGGLALGTGLALALQFLDDRIRTGADAKDDGRGVPLLATVPRVAGWRQRRQAQLVTRSSSRSPASEAYRSLGTSLAFLRIEQPMSVVQVTSPMSGEGKTTTAANLAVALARAGGERVLLLDGDLLRPRVHRFFGLPAEPGLAQVLLDGVEPAAAVREVEGIPGLSVLPAGPSRPEANADLLRSEAFRVLLARLRTDFGIVVVDTPPVLAVADPLVVAESADAVVVVVAAGSTRRRQLQASLDLLAGVGAPVVGVVLNAFDERSAGAYGTYGYGSSTYGYGQAQDDASPSRARGARVRRQRQPERAGDRRG